MPANALDIELCHTIRYCWESLDGQQAFKNVGFNEQMAEWFPVEHSREKQITNTWICGNSANRLCQLLTGKEMENNESPNTIDLASEEQINQAIEAMCAKTGCVLVRINITGGNAGHAYIFLGRFREDKSEPLVGQIYQTNVGCDRNSAFDLLAWINDPKYEEVVDLKAHLDELRSSLVDKGDPAGLYQKNYMLSANPLQHYEKVALRNPQTAATARIGWQRLNPLVARARLWNLRNPNPGRKWVLTGSGYQPAG